MKWNIEMTWSKIVAVLVLAAAVWLDLENDSVQAFMFSIPFITTMIGLKQLNDRLKLKNGGSE